MHKMRKKCAKNARECDKDAQKMASQKVPQIAKAQWRRTLAVGAPPRVHEGELRQLETGELVRALARASPGDEDVPVTRGTRA